MPFGEDWIANEITLRNNYFFSLPPRAKKGGSRSCATARKRKRKMKKLMFAAAVAAGLVAFGDGIESYNTVGYNTDTIAATKFNMVSVPFESTDGDGFKINQCLSGVNLTGTADPATADLIQIWDAATGAYEIWYYYEAGDEYTGWWDAATAMKMFEDVYPNGLPTGTAFWYKSAAAATQNGTVAFSGQVPDAASIDFEILKGKFNMVAYPYPVALKLNDASQVSWANATGTADPATADLIQIWDAATGAYEIWYYYFANDEYTGWWDAATAMKMFEDVYSTGLAVGKPFWYKAAGATGTFDITFTK